MYIASPGRWLALVVLYTPLVNPLSVLVARLTDEYPIFSEPIVMTPVTGKPEALDTTIERVPAARYDANVEIL